MTRLLVPEMFGVMAIANVFMLGLALFSDIGLRQNVIQSNRGDDPSFLNTVWTVQIIRGGMIWFLAVGLSLGIQYMSELGIWSADSVYAEPILPFVMGVIAFNAVINGFESTKFATANRSLLFGIMIRIEVTSQVAGLFAMIAWALIDRSIWALVLGSLTGSCLKTILSHAWLPGLRNKLLWNKDAVADIFRFGGWIFLASIVGFLVNSGDRILLGGLVGSQVLGLYVIAFFLVDAIQQVFGKIIGNVAYPALSEVVRGPRKDIKEVYYRIRLPIDMAALLGCGFIFACGSLIVQLLYDDRYLAAGHMLEVLSIGLIGVRYNVAGTLFMAMGKPHLLLPIISARLIPLYFLLPVSFSLFGLDGAIWIAGGSILFSLPVIFYLKIKYEIFDTISELRVLPLIGVGYSLGLIVIYVYDLV